MSNQNWIITLAIVAVIALAAYGLGKRQPQEVVPVAPVLQPEATPVVEAPVATPEVEATPAQ